MGMIMCPKCGNSISDRVSKCMYCGEVMSQNNASFGYTGGYGNQGASYSAGQSGGYQNYGAYTAGQMGGAACARCGANNVMFNREASGPGGSFKTVGICGSCGYTWTAYGDASGSVQGNAMGYGQASQKDKMTALLLCFFLGYFGAHQFYVGKSTMGLIYIFTVGLFGIGWIIDLLMILGGSFKDANGLPLR